MLVLHHPVHKQTLHRLNSRSIFRKSSQVHVGMWIVTYIVELFSNSIFVKLCPFANRRIGPRRLPHGENGRTVSIVRVMYLGATIYPWVLYVCPITHVNSKFRVHPYRKQVAVVVTDHVIPILLPGLSIPAKAQKSDPTW